MVTSLEETHKASTRSHIPRSVQTSTHTHVNMIVVQHPCTETGIEKAIGDQIDHLKLTSDDDDDDDGGGVVVVVMMTMILISQEFRADSGRKTSVIKAQKRKLMQAD